MYESSKNLIDDPAFKPHVKTVFRLRANQDIGVKRSMYLCPYCKKIWKTNPLQQQSVQLGLDYNYVCKHCGTEVDMKTVNSYEAVGCMHTRTFSKKHHKGKTPVIYDMSSIQSILIGMKKDDVDGHIISVNGTIFRQRHVIAYWFDNATQTFQQTYNTYQIKSRIVCNLDVKQVYLIDESKEQNDQFEYVVPKVHHSFYTNSNYDSDESYILRKLILQKIYEDAYGYSLPSLVANLKSVTNSQLFYMMKFPVLSSYAFYMSLDVSPVLFDILYFLSNDDRKLRPYITCRDFTEYETMWKEYFSKTFRYDLSITKQEPWFLILGWQLGHIGFKDIQSVFLIYDELKELRHSSNTNGWDTCISRFIWMLTMKRHHALKKLFNRLIKCHGESKVTAMIVGGPACTYDDWVFHYHQQTYFELVSLDFKTFDFTKPLCVILDECEAYY